MSNNLFQYYANTSNIRNIRNIRNNRQIKNIVMPTVYTEYTNINRLLTYKSLTEKDFTSESINEECPICYEIMETANAVITECNHKFCMSCILGTIWSNVKNNPENKPSCPICRCELHINPIHPVCNSIHSTCL